MLGRYVGYVATELGLLGRYVVTEPWLELGRYVATELGLCVVQLPYSSLSVAGLDTCLLPWDNQYLVRSRLEHDFTARLFVKIFFTKNHFRRKCSC